MISAPQPGAVRGGRRRDPRPRAARRSRSPAASPTRRSAKTSSPRRAKPGAGSTSWSATPRSTRITARSTTLTDEVFERMMTNNVQSNFWLSKLVVPDMKASARTARSSSSSRSAALKPRWCIADVRHHQGGRLSRCAATSPPNGGRTGCASTASRRVWSRPSSPAPFTKTPSAAPAARRRRRCAASASRTTSPAPRCCSPHTAGAFITGQIIIVDGGVMIA